MKNKKITPKKRVNKSTKTTKTIKEDQERRDYLEIIAEDIRDQVQIIKEGYSIINDKIDNVKSELVEFKNEMYEFRDEMYGFKNEMYEFRDETNSKFATLFDYLTAIDRELKFMRLEIKEIRELVEANDRKSQIRLDDFEKRLDYIEKRLSEKNLL